jgi:hypothetical protein
MAFMRKNSDSIPSIFPTYLLPSVPFRRKSRQSSTDSTESTTSTFSTISTTSMNPFHRSPTPVPAIPNSSPIIPPSDTDKFLTGHSSRLHCAKCSTDLCLSSQIISKGFTGRHGRAYLVQGSPSHIYASTTHTLANTYQNKPVPRSLVTGQHMVSDISCAICGTVIGWKYVQASEESQKYKIGKYILETKRIRVGVSWENDDDDNADTAYDEILPLPPDQLRNLDGPSRLGVGGGGGSAPFSARGASRSPARSPSPGFGGRRSSSDRIRDDGAATALASGRQAAPQPVIEFDSQDEDECEDLFAGVWSPQLAVKRRQRRSNRIMNKHAAVQRLRLRNASEDTLSSR